MSNNEILNTDENKDNNIEHQDSHEKNDNENNENQDNNEYNENNEEHDENNLDNIVATEEHENPENTSQSKNKIINTENEEEINKNESHHSNYQHNEDQVEEGQTVENNEEVYEDDGYKLEAKNSKELNDYYKIYNWVENFKFSRPKKNLTRDFSDGVCFVEIIKSISNPPIMDLHNVANTLNKQQKYVNWKEIQKKMNAKSLIKITDSDVQGVIEYRPYCIEQILEKVYYLVSIGKSISKQEKFHPNDKKNYIKSIPSK